MHPIALALLGLSYLYGCITPRPEDSSAPDDTAKIPDDSDSSVDTNNPVGCIDVDEDGYCAVRSDVFYTTGKNSYEGYDCNDKDSSVYRWIDLFTDADGDGYTLPGDAQEYCMGD